MSSSTRNNDDYERWLEAHSNKTLFNCVMQDCVKELKDVEKFALKYQNVFLDAIDNNTRYVNSLEFSNDAQANAARIIRVMDRLFAL